MRSLLVLLLFLGTANAVFAQEPEFVELDDTRAVLVARVGSALVLETAGPQVSSGNTLRTGVPYRWFVVQDSTTGVIFRKRGGLKTDGTGGLFDGDIDVRTTRETVAIEFGIATFNVWNEFTGAWFVTDIRRTEEGSEFDLNPRKAPCRFDEDSLTGIVCYSMHKHYTSVLWISRIRYADGTIEVKSVAPVQAAIATFADEISPGELEPEGPLVPAPPKEIET